MALDRDVQYDVIPALLTHDRHDGMVRLRLDRTHGLYTRSREALDLVLGPRTPLGPRTRLTLCAPLSYTQLILSLCLCVLQLSHSSSSHSLDVVSLVLSLRRL